MNFATTVTATGTLQAVAAIVALVAIAVLGVVAARDMKRRGRDGAGYGILIWLAWPIGVLVWLIHRGRHEEIRTTVSTER